MKIIKDQQLVEDQWSRVDAEADLPAGDVIVPYPRWVEQGDDLSGHQGRIAVCLNGDDPLEDFGPKAQDFELVCIEFPSFRDGRGYSFARLLRDRYGYQGELRAVGDVLRDQLLYMHRSGFNAFAIREDRDPEDALKAFDEMSVFYQRAADGQGPLFRQRQ